MTTNDKLDLYERFNEGYGLDRSVHLLIQAVRILLGLGYYYDVGMLILTLEKLIRDDMELARIRVAPVDDLAWEAYDKIDPELYTYILDGDKKLTKSEYYAN